jgi:hypothetical protein
MGESKGSKLQTQLYVNKRTSVLNDAIRGTFEELEDADFVWRSPLADNDYAEYWDGRFLAELGLGEHHEALKQFWPSGGPHWDALANVTLPEVPQPGVLLVEGKSYPNEMLKGSPVDPEVGSASRVQIERALAWTQGRVGRPLLVDAWTGPLYQNANRLAHLYWLEACGVQAWLVHLLFTGDPHGSTTETEWEAAIELADERLGLTGTPIPRAGHVCLEAGTYAELVADE